MLKKKSAGAPASRSCRLVAAPDGRLQIRSLWGLAYILPAMLLLLAFTLYPLVMVLRTAFYQKYVYITNSGTGFGWPARTPPSCCWWLCPSPWRWPLARRC